MKGEEASKAGVALLKMPQGGQILGKPPVSQLFEFESRSV
jgi:hypothetical protein